MIHKIPRLAALFLGSVLILCSSCAVFRPDAAPNISYDEFPRRIPVPEPTGPERERFNVKQKGDYVTVKKKSGETFSGYVTSNKVFLEEVMIPALQPHMDDLAAMDPARRINVLTLFGHETYRSYFGTSYFSWGGDLFDLDDPQERGPNYDARYGFDCSGFASMPYALAVHLGLMSPYDEAAVFSPQGFQLHCERTGMEDKGGRDGASNQYRLDSGDMARLGREIFVVKKDQAPAPEQLALLQPGDVVVLPEGHVGIIVEIEEAFYYLEAGGWVVPLSDGLPCEAGEALRVFAKKGDLYIRRSLPDRRE